jgi:2-haloacid dehalogenase
MTRLTCIFDAYGTLFDVAAAARAVARERAGSAFADRWAEVAEHWRQKQLSYSWLRQITGDYADFWDVTADALDWALDAAGFADPELRSRLLALYEELEAFPEVPATLTALRQTGARTAILSNGSPRMLAAAVASAGIGDLLDDVLSVEAVGVFKPDARVYAMVGARFGTAPADVLFVSSNGWDVAGAAAFGFRTAWVNRRGEPVDRLPGQPDHVMTDLSGLQRLAGSS